MMSSVVHGGLYAVVVVSVILLIVTIGLWFERKYAALMQSRMGPTMVGWKGLLQPIADTFKLLQKEDIVPDNADRPLFNLAPILAAMFALVTIAVVPLSADMIAADLDIGVIYIMAFGALTVVPTFMAGWASNNKFALLGAMRAVAQSISYEVPMVLAAMVPVIFAGSMSVSEIVGWQATHHWMIGLGLPTILGLPAFLIFFLAMLAEANRIPFDIPEAESELVAGITTEYTGMKFALFYLGEYVHTLVGSAVASALFLGGWDGPFAPGLIWMVGKTLVLFAAVFWVRWTLLRFRSDQLLKMCWYYLVPVTVAMVLIAATVVQLGVL